MTEGVILILIFMVDTSVIDFENDLVGVAKVSRDLSVIGLETYIYSLGYPLTHESHML